MTGPNILKAKGDCNCGMEECTEYGSYRKRESSNGKLCVTTCTACRSCRNGLNSKRGNSAQRKAARTLTNLGKGTGAGGEERWRFVWRTEVKNDEQAQQVEEFYRRTRDQSDEHKAYGDPRIFVPIAMCGSTAYVVVPILKFEDAAYAWIEGSP
jgi:hypothetical protein